MASEAEPSASAPSVPPADTAVVMKPADQSPSNHSNGAVLADSLPKREGSKIWGATAYANADPSRWVVIYPHYLDSTRKASEGRKISKENAVERPNASEIFDCVRSLGLRTQLELDKSYCRDCWVLGRVRIQLFDDAGAPVRPNVAANRQALFLKVASMIPSHRADMKCQAAPSKAPSKAGGGGDGGGVKGGKGAATTTSKKKKKGKR